MTAATNSMLLVQAALLQCVQAQGAKIAAGAGVAAANRVYAAG